MKPPPEKVRIFGPSVAVRFLVPPLALLLVAAGCGPDPYAGKIKLRYMAWGNPQQLAVEQRLCDAFNRENPTLHVDLLRVPGSAYGNKMIVMFASRTAADVVRVDHYSFPRLVEKDYFLDMTPYATNDPSFHLSDFFPTSIQEGLYKTHLYGLNVLFGGLVVYYNKTMMRQAGLVDPYELSQRGQWTWDRFRQYSMALSRFDGSRPTRFGALVPTFPMDFPATWALGGDVMSPDRTRSTFSTCAPAITYWRDLMWKDHGAPTPSEGANNAFTFESGKVGMAINWMGMTPTYRQKATDFEWDVCPMPIGPDGNQTAVKGNQLVIYKETQHPKEAWTFAKFMTSPEAERLLYVQLRRSFPTRKAVAYSPEYLEAKLPPHQMGVFVHAVETGKTLPITDRWDEQSTLINAAYEQAYSSPNEDIPTLLKETEAKINSMLAEEEGW